MRYFKECCSDEKCGPGNGRILRGVGHVILGVVAFGAVAVLLGWVAMTAWNAVMPALFNLPVIAFWQAVGLLVLGRLLTGRFHHRHHGRYGRHECFTRSFHRRKEGGDALDGASFAQWWWEEGEAAFRLYQARRADEAKAG